MFVEIKLVINIMKTFKNCKETRKLIQLEGENSKDTYLQDQNISLKL